MQEEVVLGVDIGGTGIKGALVDITTGKLVSERFRLETPQPSFPDAVAKTFQKLVKHFKWKDRIGCGFPAIMKKGTAHSAANIHKDWKNTNVERLLSKASNCPVCVINDADAAGVAEMHFGLGKGVSGSVILITIGTGLGSALFLDGTLVPNSELGHLYLKGQDAIAEHYASNSARKREGLSWTEWGQRFNEYLNHLELLFSPDLIILGGGACKKFDKFSDQLILDTKVVPATLQNNAGIVGGAAFANKMVFD